MFIKYFYLFSVCTHFKIYCFSYVFTARLRPLDKATPAHMQKGLLYGRCKQNNCVRIRTLQVGYQFKVQIVKKIKYQLFKIRLENFLNIKKFNDSKCTLIQVYKKQKKISFKIFKVFQIKLLLCFNHFCYFIIFT